MNRFLTCLLAAAVLAGCALGGNAERSDAAVIVGIGDQTPATFSDPLFTDLEIKRTRYFPPWNVRPTSAQRPSSRPGSARWRRPTWSRS